MEDSSNQHLWAAAGSKSGIREHCNTRVKPEGGSGVSGSNSDVGQLLGVRLHVHSTVTIHQHLVRQAHEEDTTDEGHCWILQHLHAVTGVVVLLKHNMLLIGSIATKSRTDSVT